MSIIKKIYIKLTKQYGFSVLEIILAVALFAIIASGAVASMIGSFSATRLAEEQTQAGMLAAEGAEAVQSIRDQSWNNVTNGAHGLTKSSGQWAFNSTSDVTGKFTRVITILDVFRDAGGTIVTTGGTLDPDTKKVLVVVSWLAGPNRNNGVTINIYVTRWRLGKNIAPPTPTPTAGPTATPTPANCNAYCLANYSVAGACKKPNQCTGIQAGKILDCTGPNTCCCQ
jgi:prepilin-type N-terminal cleavage/methylation domain-containing protein